MKTRKRDLSISLNNRLEELKNLKKQGIKIVGYIPGGFVPEELIWAGGAVPVALNRGGDHGAVLKSLEYIPRFIDTYSRSQIGYWALEEPLYRLIDLIIVPCTDKNIAAIADSWEMWTNTRLFRLGVPHNNTTGHAHKYYVESLNVLKGEIERLTGNSITDSKLTKEIEVGNRIRYLLRHIAESRKSDAPPISGTDFVKLHHASLWEERYFMLSYLEKLSQELSAKTNNQGPRIFLIGSSIAEGDYKVYQLLESAGANVVIEDFSEGMRSYRQDVEISGDLIKDLADAYFLRVDPPPAFFRPAEGRKSSLLKMAREFRVDGIVWYSLLYREAHEIEGIHFGRIAEKEGLRFLRISSDYDDAEREALRTRIEAFVESLKAAQI
jgi:benzoyl-CoA reductase/2-hydroxyglutaryl-CoA dehydratase subunit BcrC/BadD/HgdB